MINGIYLDNNISSQMKSYFKENLCISLQDFFKIDVKNLYKKISKLKFKQEIILDEYSKEIFKNRVEDKDIKSFIEFLKSKDFTSFLQKLTNKKLKLQILEIQKFKHKDYIIIKDKKKLKDKIIVIFDLTKKWKDDFGGTQTYTTQKEEKLYLKPSFNILTIIKEKKNFNTYLKYINVNSKNNSIIRFYLEFY